MRFCKIKANDVVNGEGVCVSLWTQGCPHHCKGCFNKETWSFEDGKIFKGEHVEEILELLDANGVHRNLSILGGEPLHESNAYAVFALIELIKSIRPETKIYVWTGYRFEDLILMYGTCDLRHIDVLIDGRFEEDKKDIRLKLRGSSNQRIINVKESIKNKKVTEIEI